MVAHNEFMTPCGTCEVYLNSESWFPPFPQPYWNEKVDDRLVEDHGSIVKSQSPAERAPNCTCSP